MLHSGARPRIRAIYRPGCGELRPSDGRDLCTVRREAFVPGGLEDDMSTTNTTALDPLSAGPIDVRLFTIPRSHPGMSVQLMLDHKGIPYKRTDLLPIVSWGVLKALRFPRVTVPAIKIDGRRIPGLA